MIAADLTLTTQRIEAMDFTIPFLASDLTVLAKVVSIFFFLYCHSSEIRGLCLVKLPSEMLQNLPYPY